MSEIVDARGLACPEPVLRVKNVMDKIGSGVIKVMVNTTTARENIKRMANSQKWSVDIAEDGDDWLITLTK